MKSFLRAAAWLFALAAVLPAAGQDDAPLVRKGAHFKVICHFQDAAVADAALETVEATWPVAAEVFGSSKEKPDKTPELHLYRTLEEYRAVDQKISGGKFQWNNGFSQSTSMSSHIGITPPCTDTVLRIVKLPSLCRRLISHEASHLVVYGLVPNSESHPSWLAEGSACWISQEVMKAKQWAVSDEGDPMNSSDIVDCRRLLEEKTFPELRKILLDDIEDIEVNARYSVKYGLFRFLKTGKHREAFKGILKEIVRMGGGTDFEKRVMALFEKAFPGKKLDDLEADFHAFLRGLTPLWRESGRNLGSLGDEWIQIAFPDNNAIGWKTAPAGEPPYALKGQMEMLPGDTAQMNVLLGWAADESFVSVAFVPDYISIFHYQPKRKEPWEQVKLVKIPAVRAGRRLRFEISVGKERLGVSVEGLPVVEIDVPAGRKMTGPWGVGVQAGAAGLWRGVKLER